jgi:hypothetical protein
MLADAYNNKELEVMTGLTATLHLMAPDLFNISSHETNWPQIHSNNTAKSCACHIHCDNVWGGAITMNGFS